MKKTITKILMAFTLMLSLTTASNADFYVNQGYSNTATYIDSIGKTALKESYAKPMKFIDVESKGSKFGVKEVYKVNFKTPFLGKHHHLHFSLENKNKIRVLQASQTYSTLWPPGHFKGH
jgi:hypothetical protein